MGSKYSIRSLVIVCFLVSSVSVYAASNPRVSIDKHFENSNARHIEGILSQSPAARGNEIGESFRYLDDHKLKFNLNNPAQELKVLRSETDPYGSVHVRFDQQYHGIRVYGRQLLTHFNNENYLSAVNAKLEENITLDPQPQVSSTEALVVARDDLRSFFGDAVSGPTELIVFPWEENHYLAWNIRLTSDSPPGNWEYFVDAHSGEIIFKANRIMTAESIGTGFGVMGNTYEHIDTYENSGTYYLTDYTRRANNNIHGHNGLMGDNEAIRTYIASSSLPGSIATDADNLWTASSQASAVDAHMYTTLFYDWLLSHLGRNSFTDNGSSLSTTVDYIGEGYNNAYWNGSRIVVWGWSSSYRSLATCPDVIAHEWGHAVTQYCSNLIYQKESGALNESFSDMIGAAFEFAHPEYDNPDWYMGENGQLFGNGFRDMANPPAMGDPDTYGPVDPNWKDVISCIPSNQNDWCGVHTNSGVGNKWFYLLSNGGTHNNVTVEGIGVQNAIQIAYLANAFYWTSSSTYEEAAYGTISAANMLDTTYAWTIQASNAWAAVGIDAPNPEIGIAVDTNWGWVPLAVNFEGSSVLNVSSWTWDFGDGDSASAQLPTHTYTEPGVFDVTLQINAEGDLKTLSYAQYIIALADTLHADTAVAAAGEQVLITIRGNNSIPVNSLRIPIEHAGDFSIQLDSISTAGCRTDYFETKDLTHYDPFNKRFTIRIENSVNSPLADLPPGSGDLVKIYATISASASPGQTVDMVLDGYTDHLPRMNGLFVNYETATNNGQIQTPNCTVKGDLNADQTFDIADLLYFVDYSFDEGPEPVPLESADVNCSGAVDVSDLLYVVDYMFDFGPEPCGCQ